MTRSLAAWYTQLSRSLSAGISVIDALRTAAGPENAATAGMAERLAQGEPFARVLDDAPPWLPETDRHLLSAAHESGKLPEITEHLSESHEQAARTRSRVMLALLYPAAVLHLALFLFPILAMIDWEQGFEWSLRQYLGSVALGLFIIWWLIGVLVFLRRKHPDILHTLMAGLPGLRGYRRERSLSEFSLALGLLLEAGVPIARAWIAAGRAGGTRRLRDAATRIAAAIDNGRSPGRILADFSCFPPDFIGLYLTGEQTGRLEDTLLKLASEHGRRADRYLTMVTLFYPGFALLGVLGFAALRILQFFSRYYAHLEALAE